MLVGYKGRHLVGGDVAQDVETRGGRAGDAVEDLLGLARADSAFERAAGVVDAAGADPLAGEQVLLKLFEDAVLHLDGDVFEFGDGLGDFLNLEIAEEFHHFACDFLA